MLKRYGLLGAVLMHAQMNESGAGGLGTMTATPPLAQPAVEAPVMYMVLDSNASPQKPRRHTIIVRQFDDGREPETKAYDLQCEGVGTPMPMDHALKFLTDKSFIVLNPKGDRILPPANADRTGPLVLQPDQTVAFYHELTKPSLYKRCKVIPGGERIQGSDEVETMISFIQAWERKKATPVGGDVDDVGEKFVSGDLGGKADDSQMTQMFGERSPLLQRN